MLDWHCWSTSKTCWKNDVLFKSKILSGTPRKYKCRKNVYNVGSTYNLLQTQSLYLKAVNQIYIG